MNKDELKAELTARGVKFHHALGEEKLKALLDESDNKSEDNQEEKVDKTTKEKEIKSLGVFDGLKLIRVFSEELHGEDFDTLADQFATKKGYELREYVAPAPVEEEPEDTEKVTVLTSNNQVVRTFSLREHGEGYEALADQFVAKFAKRGYKV